MLDTLMVLLMKGVRAPLLRALSVFLFVCVVIGALLALVTISGVRWPGMVATASSVPNTSHGPVAAPSPMDASIPIILQNPCAVTPTPMPTVTPGATYTTQAPAPVRASTPASTPTDPPSGLILPQTPLIHSILDPLLSKILYEGLSSTNLTENCLSNSVATPTSRDTLSRLQPLFWLLLATTGLLSLCGLGLFVLGARRKHRQS